ncbi:MAG: polynucleotide adenylyltransferase PcnB [Acidiferrobacterales bacterium]|nr:polynucleotide adenylyltransferase PcnB [Acidiferrobacterales bacterium]
MSEPQVIQQSEHGIDIGQLSGQAVEVIHRLNRAGFSGELVGGCVRDLLLGKQPKDFDVSTNATPEQVKRLFERATIIGRRFRLVEVRIGCETVQVATYRAAPGAAGRKGRQRNFSPSGKILKDNNYGDIEQDAFRRDLTINALFLNPSEMTILDYTGGFDDIRDEIVRVIGSPSERYQEDPVRMLRTIRFAASLDFEIDPDSAEPLPDLSRLLADVSNSRMSDELKKLFFSGCAVSTFGLLNEFGIFTDLFPGYSKVHGYSMDESTLQWLTTLCQEMDVRVRNAEPLSFSYTLAAVLWLPYSRALRRENARRNGRYFDPLRLAKDVLKLQNQRTYISKVHGLHILEIWRLQKKMQQTKPGTRNIIDNPRFRAAVRLLQHRIRFEEVAMKSVLGWIKVRDSQPVTGKNRPRRRRRFKPRVRN